MKTTSKAGMVNMADPKQLIQHIFAGHNISIPPGRAASLDKFLSEEQNIHAIKAIIENQNLLINKWQMENRISEIIQQPLRILNGTVGKPYEARFDPDIYNWKDISEFQFKGLEQIGLTYDEKLKQIIGVPSQSGDFKIIFEFKLKNESKELPFNEKSISLIINPDPKSLWKNIEGDRNDPYWKENDVTIFEPIGDRHILASSKRGRAHANKGLFREDDFAFTEFDSGWNLVTFQIIL